MEIGKKLKNARIEAGLTQEKAAEKINVSQSFISRLVSGEKVPSDRTIAEYDRDIWHLGQ